MAESVRDAALREGLQTGAWEARDRWLAPWLDAMHTWFRLHGVEADRAADATTAALIPVLASPLPPDPPPHLWLLRAFLLHAPAALGRHPRAREDLSVLAGRWRRLPPDLQHVLWLREICDQPVDRISTILEIPTSTVRVRLQRARQEIAGPPPEEAP